MIYKTIQFNTDKKTDLKLLIHIDGTQIHLRISENSRVLAECTTHLLYSQNVIEPITNKTDEIDKIINFLQDLK